MMSFADFLQDLMKYYEDRPGLGRARCIARFREAVGTRLQQLGKGGNIDDGLDALGCRGLYREAIRGDQVDFVKLAKLYRRLGVSTDVFINRQDLMRPWDRWPAGATLLVVLSPHYPRADPTAKGMYDGHDLEVPEMLRAGLAEAGIEADVKTRRIDKQLSSAAAEDLLREMREEQGVGGILNVGLKNPLAAAAGRAIFGHDRAGYPAGPIRAVNWRHDDLPTDSYLFDPVKCRPDQEGIRLELPGQEPVSVPRVSHATVKQKYRTADPGPLDLGDAAVTLLDCRSFPFLGLLAGHSAVGTIAAARALLRQFEVARQLQQPAKGLPQGVVLLLLQVLRVMERAPDNSLHYRLLDDEYGRGWKYAAPIYPELVHVEAEFGRPR